MKKSNRSFVFLFLILVIAGILLLSNQKKKSVHTQFIETLSEAIPQDTSVFPSVIMAQAILESNWGESSLSKNAHNYFGIKAKDTSQPHTLVPTQEFIDGKMVDVDDIFRKYKSMHESILDYLDLMNLERYTPVRQAQTFEEAATALYDAGYATDPDYTKKLLDLIETHRLFIYDTK